jgi:hypothetical protein
MASIDVPPPLYTQDPFFSLKFRSMIVVGTFFVYLNKDDKDKKPQVGRVINARKAVLGHEVKCNIFETFSQWKSPKGQQHPIEDGLAKDLAEIVLTPKTTNYFSFEEYVIDLAFVFTEEQLFESGAYLDGIANAYVCRFEDNGEEVKGIMPFPCQQPFNLCPLPQSYAAKVFFDIEALRARMYLDLNRRSELQGDVAKTYNCIPFSAETWAYFKWKLDDFEVKPIRKKVFFYGLTRQMKRIKLQVNSYIELLRIDTSEGMESLRSILGSTISYGLRAQKASVRDNWVPIENNCAVNYVIVDENGTNNFVPLPPASAGGFDFIHNGKNSLFLRTRYRKALYRSNSGCIPLEELKLPTHFQELLKPVGWGCWEAQEVAPVICIGDLFDWDDGTYRVEAVYEDRVDAYKFGTKQPITSFIDLDEVSEAIAQKREE